MSLARSLAIIVGLLLLLTWLSWRAINPNAEQFDYALNELDRLGVVQDALYRDLLAERTGLLRNYDPLVHEMSALHQSVTQLQEIASFDTQTARAINRVKISIDREETLIESFKRENAVLRTSLSFFARFATRTDEREIDVAIGAAATAILHLTLDTSSDALAEAAMQLEDLKRQAEKAGQFAQVQPLLAHGRLLQRLLPSLDNALRQVMTLAKKTDQDALRGLIQMRQLSSRNEARFYRVLLYVTSLLLVAFLAHLGIRLKVLVGDLHRRAGLEHLLADISMQFVNAEPESVDLQIQRAIAQLASHLGCQRAYLLMPESTGKSYLWQAAREPFPVGWPEGAPDLAIQMGYGEDRAINVPLVSRLAASPGRSLLEELGINAWAYATGSDRQGRQIALGLEVVGSESVLLKPEECVFLRMLLDTFIHAVNRGSVEEERSRLHRRLQHARRMEKIGTFTSGIAHNFNNILGGILGHAEMMEELAAGSGGNSRHLVGIRRSAERARNLIRGILMFGSHREPRRTPVSVVELAKETISLLRASLASQIELEVKSDPSGLIVSGEAAQLQQIFMNLCQNAANAMADRGSIHVILELCASSAANSFGHVGKYVKISILDTGVGMDATVLDRIFEPFFTTRPDGNGLGLATVREIVRDHGGEINVESALGEGSRFDVWLPAVASTILSPEKCVSVQTGGHGEVVMLVVSDRDRLLGEEEKLAALGYEAVGFATAEAAVQDCKANPNRYDCVVVSQLGTLAQTVELAAELRRALLSTPIVLAAKISSDVRPDDLLAAGISDVVGWPILTGEIAAALSQFSRTNGESLST